MKYIKKYWYCFINIFNSIKIQDSNFVMKVENILYDVQTIFIEKSDYNDVVIVDIDEKSIGEIGQFPWRRCFANLIDRLNQYGVLLLHLIYSLVKKINKIKKILEEFNIDNNTVLIVIKNFRKH